MKTTDMRFDETVFHEMIGKIFDKYRCDRLDATNSVRIYSEIMRNYRSQFVDAGMCVNFNMAGRVK